MKTKLIIADAGPLFSLAAVDQLHILLELFEDVKIPQAVWEEITLDETTEIYPLLHDFFNTKVVPIKGFNDLTFVMDYGESESVILYRELNADFLLIDDKKARAIAESFEINCIGTLGILSAARTKKLIPELRPIFQKLIAENRFYAIELLNVILKKHGEDEVHV